MQEQVSIKERYIDIREIKDVLLDTETPLLDAPRSIRIRMPRSAAEFALGLQQLAQLPVECLMSYDAAADALMVTTGVAHSTYHHLINTPEAITVLKEQVCAGPTFHNHPPYAGWVKRTPSDDDWSTLMTTAKKSGMRTSWIVTSEGFTVYTLLPGVPLTKAWRQSARSAAEAYAPLSEVLAKYDRAEEFTAEDKEQILKYEARFAQVLGGEVRVIPWSMWPMIAEELDSFLDFCTYQVDEKRQVGRSR